MTRSILLCLLSSTLLLAQEGIPSWTNEVETLRTLSAEHPKNLGLRLRLARALLRDAPEAAHPRERKKRAKEAEATLEGVLKDEPRARVPLEVLTLVEYRWGDMERVVSLGGRLLEDYPGHEEVARRVMKAQLRLGHHEAASKVFLSWLRSGAVRSFGGILGLMGTYARIPEARKALNDALDAALAQKPRDVDALLWKAAFLTETGDLPGAWKLVRKAERLGAANLRTGGRPYLVTRLLGRCPEPEPGAAASISASLEVVEAATKAEPDHAGHQIRLARLLRRAGRVEDALPCYRKAAELNPDYWAAHQLYGDLLLDLDRAEEAVEPLRRGLALLPHFQPARLRLAQALLKVGKVKEAAGELAHAGLLFAPDPVSRAVIKDAIEKGKTEVVGVFQKAVAEHDKCGTLLGYLALAQHFSGQEEAARKSALAAERLGLIGPAGLPAAIMWEVFGKTPPKSGSGRR